MSENVPGIAENGTRECAECQRLDRLPGTERLDAVRAHRSRLVATERGLRSECHAVSALVSGVRESVENGTDRLALTLAQPWGTLPNLRERVRTARLRSVPTGTAGHGGPDALGYGSTLGYSDPAQPDALTDAQESRRESLRRGMALLTADDAESLRSRARAFVSAVRDMPTTVDAGDVAQEATTVLARILSECDALTADRQGEPYAVRTRKDGTVGTYPRTTLTRWAVRDAARNLGVRFDPSMAQAADRAGYSLDGMTDAEGDALGAQVMAGTAHVQGRHVHKGQGTDRHPAHYAAAYLRTAQGSEAWQSDRWTVAMGTIPADSRRVLGALLRAAESADDLGRGGVWQRAAQETYGGALGSRRQVTRFQDAASAAWSDARDALDAVPTTGDTI